MFPVTGLSRKHEFDVHPPPRRSHAAGVRSSLGSAEEAAARGAYAEALEWLGAVEAADQGLSDEYKGKRERWSRAQAGAEAR